jgi:hypothetical protein
LAYFAGLDKVLNLLVKTLPGEILGNKIESFGNTKMTAKRGVMMTLNNFQTKIINVYNGGLAY